MQVLTPVTKELGSNGMAVDSVGHSSSDLHTEEEQLTFLDVPIFYWHEHQEHSARMRKHHHEVRERFRRISSRVESYNDRQKE